MVKREKTNTNSATVPLGTTSSSASVRRHQACCGWAECIGESKKLFSKSSFGEFSEQQIEPNSTPSPARDCARATLVGTDLHKRFGEESDGDVPFGRSFSQQLGQATRDARGTGYVLIK